MREQAVQLLLALLFRTNPYIPESSVDMLRKKYGAGVVDSALLQAKSPFLLTLRARFGQQSIDQAFGKAAKKGIAGYIRTLMSQPTPYTVDARTSKQFLYCCYAMKLVEHMNKIEELEKNLTVPTKAGHHTPENTDEVSFKSPYQPNAFLATLNKVKIIWKDIARSTRLYRQTLQELSISPVYDPDNVEGNLLSWLVHHHRAWYEKTNDMIKQHPEMEYIFAEEIPKTFEHVQELITQLEQIHVDSV